MGRRTPEGVMGLQNDFTNSTGETPFSLAYGVEAMIPVEIEGPSLRRETYNQEENFALQNTSLICSKKSATWRLSKSLHTNDDMRGTSIQRSKKKGLKRATWSSEKLIPTLKRSALESSGQIRRGYTSSKGGTTWNLQTKAAKWKFSAKNLER